MLCHNCSAAPKPEHRQPYIEALAERAGGGEENAQHTQTSEPVHSERAVKCSQSAEHRALARDTRSIGSGGAGVQASTVVQRWSTHLLVRIRVRERKRRQSAVARIGCQSKTDPSAWNVFQGMVGHRRHSKKKRSQGNRSNLGRTNHNA